MRKLIEKLLSIEPRRKILVQARIEMRPPEINCYVETVNGMLDETAELVIEPREDRLNILAVSKYGSVILDSVLVHEDETVVNSFEGIYCSASGNIKSAIEKTAQLIKKLKRFLPPEYVDVKSEVVITAPREVHEFLSTAVTLYRVLEGL